MATRKLKMTDEKKATTSGHPDLTQVIRSIQRIEGKSDCFARTAMECDSPACQWSIYCLKELNKRNPDKSDYTTE